MSTGGVRIIYGGRTYFFNNYTQQINESSFFFPPPLLPFCPREALLNVQLPLKVTSRRDEPVNMFRGHLKTVQTRTETSVEELNKLKKEPVCSL